MTTLSFTWLYGAVRPLDCPVCFTAHDPLLVWGCQYDARSSIRMAQGQPTGSGTELAVIE